MSFSVADLVLEGMATWDSGYCHFLLLLCAPERWAATHFLSAVIQRTMKAAHTFICSSIQQKFSCYVPLTFLESEDLVINKTEKNPSTHGVCISEYDE